MNHYYIRLKQDDQWVNGLRDGQRYVDEQTANEMIANAEAKGIEACMFHALPNEKPVMVKRTQTGVEL